MACTTIPRCQLVVLFFVFAAVAQVSVPCNGGVCSFTSVIQALQQANSFDTVTLAAGTYTGACAPGSQLIPGAGITLVAYDAFIEYTFHGSSSPLCYGLQLGNSTAPFTIRGGTLQALSLSSGASVTLVETTVNTGGEYGDGGNNEVVVSVTDTITLTKCVFNNSMIFLAAQDLNVWDTTLEETTQTKYNNPMFTLSGNALVVNSTLSLPRYTQATANSMQWSGVTLLGVGLQATMFSWTVNDSLISGMLAMGTPEGARTAQLWLYDTIVTDQVNAPTITIRDSLFTGCTNGDDPTMLTGQYADIADTQFVNNPLCMLADIDYTITATNLNISNNIENYMVDRVLFGATTLYLSDSIINSNTVKNNALLWAPSGATLTNVVISNNVAAYIIGSEQNDEAVSTPVQFSKVTMSDNVGDLYLGYSTISESTLTNLQSQVAQVTGGYWSGTWIQSFGPLTFTNTTTITGCTFIGTTAPASGETSGNIGGAISFCPPDDSGVISATILDSTFRGNTGSAGAVFCERGTNLTLSFCTFSNNQAVTGGDYGSSAGALSVDYDAVVAVVACTFSANSAADGPGAIQSNGDLLVSGSAFTGNVGTQGGAIALIGGVARLSTSTFSGNSASQEGGAIRTGGTALVLEDGLSFTANTAVNGGAFYCSSGDLGATATPSFASNNVAYSGAGAVYCASECGCCAAANTSATALVADCLLLPALPCAVTCPAGEDQAAGTSLVCTNAAAGLFNVPINPITLCGKGPHHFPVGTAVGIAIAVAVAFGLCVCGYTYWRMKRTGGGLSGERATLLRSGVQGNR